MVEVVRLCLGVLDVSAARRMARLELGAKPDAVTVNALRVLGVRQLVQGAVTARVDTGAARRIGAVVDGLHCSSMLLLALIDRRRRGAALVQASIAALLGAAELGRA